MAANVSGQLIPFAAGTAPQLAPTTPPRGTPRTPLSAVASEAAGLPDTWEGVCDWVLAKQVAPWEQLYEAAFLQVSKCSHLVTGRLVVP